MSSDSQDFVWSVDWGDVPAADAANLKSPPDPVPARKLDPLEPVALPPAMTARAEPRALCLAAPTEVERVYAPQKPATRNLVRGERVKLTDLGLGEEPFSVGVHITHPTGDTVNITCLGLDANNRLSDERYFTFFNQPSSPCGGLSLLVGSGDYQGFVRADLQRLPAVIERLVIVAAFDGNTTMGALGPCRLAMLHTDRTALEFCFSGADFGTERALIIAEIYRRNGIWRFAAAGQGFGGGLAALLRNFGAELSE
jgi:stress response protein SCP2